MSNLEPCPKCNSNYVYHNGILNVCPECAYEWNPDMEENQDDKILDAFGNELVDGDSVIVLKDLKIKGSSSVVKKGTKVKNITLKDGDHNIDCRIDGIGAMELKSEFVKKA